MIEHDDVARDRHDRAHHMLDDDDGQARLRELSDQRHRLIDLRRVEPGHDLVEQQDARLRRQRARHFQPALVDGGEVLRRRLFLRRETDEVDRLARLFARSGDVAVAQEGAGHDVGEHGHRAEGFCDLEGAGKPERADIVRLQPDDLAAECQLPSRNPAGGSR